MADGSVASAVSTQDQDSPMKSPGGRRSGFTAAMLVSRLATLVDRAASLAVLACQGVYMSVFDHRLQSLKATAYDSNRRLGRAEHGRLSCCDVGRRTVDTKDEAKA